MPEAASLQVVVGADITGLDRGLAEAQSKVSGLGSAMQSALAGAAMAGGAAIAAGLAVGIKAAGDLQQSVANISTIKPEIDTSAVFGALNEMSTRIPATAAQLGDSLYNVFSSMDVGAEQALQLVETFAKGAAGAGTSAETFGTAAMGVMNAYGLSVADAAAVSDMFFDTINKGVVTGDELAASLGPVTQSAKAAGVQWRDLGPMIAAVTKEGGPAAQNMNNLNNLFQKFTTSAAQLAMNKMGVATIDAAGKFREVPAVLTDLKAHLATLTEAEAAAALQQIFPDAQARIGAQTLMSQIDFVNESLKTNQVASGSTAAAYEKMSATFNSQSKLLINNLMAIGTAIGAEVLPMITPMITTFSQSLPAAFQVLKDAVGTVKQVLAGEWAPDSSIHPFVLAVGNAAVLLRDQFGPAIKTVGEFISGTLAPGFQKIAAPLAAFSGGFLAAIAAAGLASTAIAAVAAVVGLLLSPLGLVALAAGALAAAWTVNFGGIQEKTAAFVAIVQQALEGDVAGAFTAFIALVGTTTQEIVAQLLLWGQAFVDWIAPMIPPMLAAALDLGTQLLAWIGAQIPLILAQLLLWGQQFVAWVAPQIPPMLAALGILLLGLGAWITNTALPAIVTQLAAWGKAFVDWVAPMIPLMLTALVQADAALIQWELSMVPKIADGLVPWGKEFVLWVPPATVAMYGALGEMAGSLVRWLVETQLKIADGVILWAKEFGKLGVASAPEIAAGLGTMLLQIETFMLLLPAKMLAWGVQAIEAFIKGFISRAIPAPTLPSFGGGAGTTGPDVTATPLSYRATTPGGFKDNAERLQFVGDVAEEYGHDRATVQRGATLEGAGPAGPVGDGGRSFGALQAYTGGGMGNTFMQQTGLDPSDPNNEKALVRWQISQLGQTGWQPYHGPVQAGGFSNMQGLNVAPPKPALRDMQRVPLGPPGGSGAPGSSPEQWPGFMNQVDEQLPAYLTSLETIRGKGTETFSSVLDAGVKAGQNLISTSFDSLGNVTTIFQDATGVIGATITDASGTIVNAWGSMATSVTEQTTALATAVPEQTNLMASGALTSITALGDGTLTTVATMAGTTIATVTDMAGQVTNQSATLANGVVLNMGMMDAGVMTSVTQMSDGTITTVTDMAGNAISTVTNMSGQVTNQYVSMGATSGAAVTTLGTTSTTQFGNVGTAARGIVPPIKEAGQAIVSIPQADMSDTVSQFKQATSAAQAYTKALVAAAKASEDLPGKGGGSKGNSKEFAKAAGGPVSAGQGYLIGEEGPEFFVPGRSGTIIPNDAISSGGTRGQLAGGGGTTIVINLTVEGSVKSERDLVDAVRSGLIEIGRRNGGADVLFSD